MHNESRIVDLIVKDFAWCAPQRVHVISLSEGVDVAESLAWAYETQLYLFNRLLVELRAMFVFKVHSLVDVPCQVLLNSRIELTSLVDCHRGDNSAFIWAVTAVFVDLTTDELWLEHLSHLIAFFDAKSAGLMIVKDRAQVVLHTTSISPWSTIMTFLHVSPSCTIVLPR